MEGNLTENSKRQKSWKTRARTEMEKHDGEECESGDFREKDKEEFNKILSWIEELNEINTDNVEPLISVNDTTLRLREDEITDGNYQEAVLANAPDKEYDYFAVPKVVE